MGNAALTIGTKIIPIPSIVIPHTKDPNQNPFYPEPTVFSAGEIRTSQGGPEVTLSGTPVSFSVMGLVVGSSTIPVNPESAAKTSLLLYEIEGTTLTQGGPAVKISGMQISAGTSNIVIGTRTIDLSPTRVLAATSQTAAIDPCGYSVAGKFLKPGGPAITVSCTKISLGLSNLVIGTKKRIVSLSQSPDPTGFDPSITSGSGFSIIATPTDRSNSPNSDAFIGAQGKLGTSAILTSLCLGMSVLIMTRLI